MTTIFDYYVQAIYPLKDLQLIGSMRLPRDVNRTKLEVSKCGCSMHAAMTTQYTCTLMKDNLIVDIDPVSTL